MAVRIEKDGTVWTVIYDWPEARNAMDPASADALTAAFLELTPIRMPPLRSSMAPAERFVPAWTPNMSARLMPSIRSASSIFRPPAARYAGDIPRGPLGPSRLELDKPVIAAIEGPAVAGGMELGLWCDFRVMAKDAYFGVYCRRWGVPLIDGGTVRLPRSSARVVRWRSFSRVARYRPRNA